MDVEAKVQQRKNPRETAGWPSVAFFWWMNSLLASGYSKDLELEDLYEPRKEDESEVLGDQLEEEWSKELVAAKEGKRKKPSPGAHWLLWKAVCTTWHLHSLRGVCAKDLPVPVYG